MGVIVNNFNKILPHFYLCIAMLVWGSSLTTMKLALIHFTPFEVMAGRMIVSAIVGIPFLKFVIEHLKNKKINKLLIFTVICQPCLFFIFESTALLYTTSGQAGMITTLSPLFATCAAIIFLKEKTSKKMFIGFGLAFLGVIWITLSATKTQSAPNPILGNFLEFGAVLCGMSFAVSVRYLTKFINPFHLTTAMSYAGMFFFVPLSFFDFNLGKVTYSFYVPTWLSILCILYLGSVVTFLGYGLYSLGISQLGVAKAVIYNNSIPVITVILGAIFLEEYITLSQCIAIFFIISGIGITQYFSNNNEK